MGLFEIIFIYVLSWWMLLLMLLPIKAGAAGAAAQGLDYHSAPKRSYLKQKMLAATLLAAIVTAILVVLIRSGSIAQWFPYSF